MTLTQIQADLPDGYSLTITMVRAEYTVKLTRWLDHVHDFRAVNVDEAVADAGQWLKDQAKK